MSTIKDRVRIVIEGSPILSSIITKEWPLHHWTHEAGGIDEVNVGGLDGVLSDPQPAGWLYDYLIDFSTLPVSGNALVFDGTKWVPGTGSGVTTVNSLYGDLVLNDGVGILITDDSADTITISNTGVLSLSSDDNAEALAGGLRLTSGTNIAIAALDDDSGFQISAIVADVKYFPTSYTAVTGTYNSGTLGQLTEFNEGGYMEFQEVTGSPGFDLRYGFGAVGGVNKVTAYLYYSGPGQTHSVHVEIYNYSTTSWTELAEFTLSPAWQLIDVPIPDDANYIDGSGNSVIRLNHDDSGITGHYIRIDYLALVRAATGTGGVTDHGALTGRSDASDHLWPFLHDGTRPATGDFDMDEHAIGEVSHIDFVMEEVSFVEGRVGWSTDDGTLSVGLAGGVSVMQIGQEMPFRTRNTSGSPMPDGTIATVTGNTADNPNIGPAIGDASVFGMVTEDILNNQYGYTTAVGLVRGMDTSTFPPTTDLWRDNGSGGVTDTQPSAGNMSTRIGVVLQQHASEGSVYVMPVEIPRLSYLSDVNVRAGVVTSGNMLVWDTAGYWDQASVAQGPTLAADVPMGFGGSSVSYSSVDTALQITSESLLWLGDAYVGASAWTVDHWPLAESAAEYDALTASYGSADHSIAWYLNAASGVGGTSLDGAYDFGGAGSGRVITVDSGPVLFNSDGSSSALQLSIAVGGPATSEPVLYVTNADSDAGIAAIGISGAAGSSVANRYGTGNRIEGSDNTVSLYAVFPTIAGGGYARFTAGIEDFDSTDYARAILEASNSGHTIHASLNAAASDGSLSGLSTGTTQFVSDWFNVTASQSVIDTTGYLKFETDQGTPTNPSLVLDTDAASTPYLMRVETERSFYVLQGNPTAATPHYSELSLVHSSGDPNVQRASLGAFAGAGGADGYAKATFASDESTGASEVYVIADTDSTVLAFLHLDADATESYIDILADEIRYNGVIGQQQTGSLTSASATINPSMGANHQAWSIGHNISAITFADVPDIYGVNYHIWITFSGSFDISAGSWPSNVDWIDGSDGLLEGASGQTYVLTLQKHGSSYIAGYTDVAV